MKTQKKIGKAEVKKLPAKRKKASLGRAKSAQRSGARRNRSQNHDEFLVRFNSGKSVADLIDFSAGKRVQIA